MTPRIASYWTTRYWNRKREEAEESDLEEDGKLDGIDRQGMERHLTTSFDRLGLELVHRRATSI